VRLASIGMGGFLASEIGTATSSGVDIPHEKLFYAVVQSMFHLPLRESNENEGKLCFFYKERIGVADILACKARYPPKEKYRMCMRLYMRARREVTKVF